MLLSLGFSLVATRGTHERLLADGLPSEQVNKVAQGRPHIVDRIKNNDISFIVNTTESKQAIADSATIRRTTLSRKVYYTTTLAGAEAVCSAIAVGEQTSVRRIQDLSMEVS